MTSNINNKLPFKNKKNELERHDSIKINAYKLSKITTIAILNFSRSGSWLTWTAMKLNLSKKTLF